MSLNRKLAQVSTLGRQRQSLRHRILFGNAVITVLLIIAAAIVALQVSRLVTAVDTLQTARRHVDAAVAVRQYSTSLFATVTRLLPQEDFETFDTEVTRVLENLKDSRTGLVTIAEETTDPETAAALQEVNDRVTSVINIGETMVRQSRTGQWQNVRLRVGVLHRDQEEVFEAVNDLFQVVQTTEDNATAQVASAQQAVIVYPTIVGIVTAVIGVMLARRIVNSITRPVERLTTGAQRLAAGSFEERIDVESDDEIGQLARTFNQMAEQLKAYYDELEERVTERTRALETSLEVSRRLSTILDRVALSREVVEQVQAAFDYYHVHIYLFDEGRESLTMVGGTGRAGRVLLARGHRLRAGQGLVGRTAAHNEVTLVPDVTQEPDWLPNPLLPETKAEVAVPIAFGGQVQGVIDVQHNQIGGLDQADVHLLQIIAAQVAVALQNAQLLEQAEARAEHANLINTINQRIQNATSVDAVLQIAAQELGRALHVERAQVELETPAHRWMGETGYEGVAGQNGDEKDKA